MGAVLVILSGMCIGLWKADELRKREDALIDLKRTVQAFRTGISYAARPLEELIVKTRDSRFCTLAASEPIFYQDPKGALERAGERLFRERADLELYRGFVRGLGDSDTQSQLEHISLYAGLLESNLAQAGEAKEKKTRLYICLGLFGGITLCLVLL